MREMRARPSPLHAVALITGVGVVAGIALLSRRAAASPGLVLAPVPKADGGAGAAQAPRAQSESSVPVAPSVNAQQQGIAVGEPAPSGLSLYWSKASILLSGMPDPYNKELSDAVIQANKSGNSNAEINKFQATLLSAMTKAMAATGVGAVVVVLWELLRPLAQAITPNSEGGWEKLTMLQRQRAVIYQITPSFEPSRNESVLTSQHLDLSVDKAPQLGSPNYATHVRNTLIRLGYAAEFYRITHTEDEAMLPVAFVNAAMQNKLWPPPVAPIPPTNAEYWGPDPDRPQWKYFNYSLAGLDPATVRTEYAKLYAEYLRDCEKYANLMRLVAFPDAEVLTLARVNGCLPALGSPANPSR